MLMKNKFILLTILGIFFAKIAFAGIASPTGIIPGALWYSKETFTADETIKIYTALWNGEKENLQAKVEFYDKNVVLGTRDVNVLPEQLLEVSVPWKVTSGDHILSAKIASSRINNVSIILNNNQTEKKRIFVPILVENENGEKVTTSNSIKDQIKKTTTEIENSLPSSISSSVSNIFAKMDEARSDLSQKIIISKDQAKSDLENIKSGAGEDSTDKSSIRKPIAEIKAFSLQALSYLFQNKTLFYIVLAVVLFFILKFIFRAIFR